MTEGWRSRAIRRLAVPVLLASLLGGVAPRPAAAAPPDFQIVTTTDYQVRPDARLVHVVVDGRATSYTPNSSGRIYYYTDVRLAVLGGASGFRATANGAPAAVSIVGGGERQMLVELPLNREVHYQQTGQFRLEFDLATGSADGQVRVGANVAAFPVWAVGTSETPGSSVSITVPRDFLLDVQGQELPERERGPGGSHVYRWTQLRDIADFAMFATADLATISEDTYAESRTDVELAGRQVQIVVQAWADDADWGRRISRAVTRGLPVLRELIGVNYFGTRRLVVVETVSRSIDGYAGIFDDSQADDEIQVAFDASDAVTLHEAAHAWFNGSLSHDRWILEGFASHYGTAAARQLDVDPEPFRITRALRAAAFPLDEWENPGIESALRELYGYAASQHVAKLLAGRVGADGLSATFAAMLRDEAPYQPLDAEAPETSYSHQNDWRYFLDIVEERTGERAGDILRDWVVHRNDWGLIDERAAAREEYAAFVERLQGWEVPGVLRQQMSAWSFDSATETIATGQPIVDRRDSLEATSEALGLAVPLDDVAAPFENGDFASSASAADRVGTVLEAYSSAVDAREEPVDAVEFIGLIGADPAANLDSAADDLEAGRWDEALASAQSADSTWRDAAGAGTARLAVGGGASGLLLIGIGAWALRGRRPRERVAISGESGPAPGS